MPVQPPTRSQPFPRSRPISDAHEDTEDLFIILNPRVPTGVLHFRIKFLSDLFIYQNAYLKFFILCCMFKIDLCSKHCVAFRHVIYFTNILLHVNTCEKYAQKYIRKMHAFYDVPK